RAGERVVSQEEKNMIRVLAMLFPPIIAISLPMAAAALEPPGRFKQADQAEQALKLVGYDNVYVFEWQGGVPGGWVQFDAKRYELPVLETARKLFKTDEEVDPSQLRGIVVIAIRSANAKTGLCECKVGLQVIRLAGEKKSGMREVNSGVIREYESE